MGGGKKVIVEPHRHEGVFISRGKEDALLTKNMVVGESVYGEKRIATEDEAGKVEYRVWNPFRSKLAAAILGGVDKIHMPPGSKVLYLGAASGTTVSHVSDVVGPEGMVYAVEFSHRSGRYEDYCYNPTLDFCFLKGGGRIPKYLKIKKKISKWINAVVALSSK